PQGDYHDSIGALLTSPATPLGTSSASGKTRARCQGACSSRSPSPARNRGLCVLASRGETQSIVGRRRREGCHISAKERSGARATSRSKVWDPMLTDDVAQLLPGRV